MVPFHTAASYSCEVADDEVKRTSDKHSTVDILVAVQMIARVESEEQGCFSPGDRSRR
jgi:hypothetical protein